jgi:hypothetical protein
MALPAQPQGESLAADRAARRCWWQRRGPQRVFASAARLPEAEPLPFRAGEVLGAGRACFRAQPCRDRGIGWRLVGGAAVAALGCARAGGVDCSGSPLVASI